MIAKIITFILTNLYLILFVIGILAGLWGIIKARPKITGQQKIDILLKYGLFYGIGLAMLYNFIIHGFFGQMAAGFIGWQQSPFQFEVAVASLGFALIGIVSRWAGFGFQAATVLSVSCFYLGAAGGHIYQMIKAHNFAPGNAGMMFWLDIIVPVYFLVLLLASCRYHKR